MFIRIRLDEISLPLKKWRKVIRRYIGERNGVAQRGYLFSFGLCSWKVLLENHVESNHIF